MSLAIQTAAHHHHHARQAAPAPTVDGTTATTSATAAPDPSDPSAADPDGPGIVPSTGPASSGFQSVLSRLATGGAGAGSDGVAQGASTTDPASPTSSTDVSSSQRLHQTLDAYASNAADGAGSA